MDKQFDELSKSLAEGVSRRDALRKFALGLMGVLLATLGLGSTAWAGGQRCGSDAQCGGSPNACCNHVCVNLQTDPNNCGACGNVCASGVCCLGQCCPAATPHCVNGVCSACPAGQTLCNGTCVNLKTNPYNCGACGNVCPPSAKYCVGGVCVCPAGDVLCNGVCVNLGNDPNNCGACGNVCAADKPYCQNYTCVGCSGRGSVCGGSHPPCCPSLTCQPCKGGFGELCCQ